MVEEDSEDVFNIVFFDVIFFMCLKYRCILFVFSDSQPTKMPQVKPVLMFVFNGKHFIHFYSIFIVNLQFL